MSQYNKPHGFLAGSTQEVECKKQKLLKLRQTQKILIALIIENHLKENYNSL